MYIPKELLYELSGSVHSDFTFKDTIKYEMSIYKALDHYFHETNKTHLDTMYLDSLFNEVMTMLINDNGNPPNDVKATYANEIIDRAIQYIYTHLEKKITVDELAGQVGLSKYHFIRLFKKVTHLTPHQYHLNLKLEYARKDLEMGFLPLNIGYKYGFHDLSHFINRFRKAYGVPPNKYQSFFKH